MSANSPGHQGSSAEEPDRSTTYVLVLIVEVIVIAGLYWLGRHFG